MSWGEIIKPVKLKLRVYWAIFVKRSSLVGINIFSNLWVGSTEGNGVEGDGVEGDGVEAGGFQLLICRIIWVSKSNATKHICLVRLAL